MKVYSDTLTFGDLHREAPASCDVEVVTIGRPRVRSRGWSVRLTCVSGSRWTNTGTHGAGCDKAASFDQHGAWMARLFEIDPSARIAFYDGRADFHRQTEDRYLIGADTAHKRAQRAAAASMAAQGYTVECQGRTYGP